MSGQSRVVVDDIQNLRLNMTDLAVDRGDLSGRRGVDAADQAGFPTQKADDVLDILKGVPGDPLLRDPEDVAVDLNEDKVTVAGALEGYGVVLVAGQVDSVATARERDAARAQRRRRSEMRDADAADVDASTGRRLDDNLVEVAAGNATVVACRHCGRTLGDVREGNLLRLARYDGPSSAAGRQVTSAPDLYVDTEVVFRQLSCPSCWTAIYSGIVPADHPDHALDIGRLLSPANSQRSGRPVRA